MTRLPADRIDRDDIVFDVVEHTERPDRELPTRIGSRRPRKLEPYDLLSMAGRCRRLMAQLCSHGAKNCLSIVQAECLQMLHRRLGQPDLKHDVNVVTL